MDFQHLLEGKSNEERLAGILLAQKFLESDTTLSVENRNNILFHLIQTVSPQFILRMLCTSTCLNEISIHDIAVYLLEKSCPFVNVIQLFESMAKDIYAVVAVSKNTRLLQFLLKVCELGGASQCEAMFRHALSVVSTTRPENMLAIFDFLVELALHWERITLSAEESKTLRSLIMEGWGSGGGAQEGLRDTFIIASIVFMSRIHPHWTIEAEDSNKGKFAMVLASIVCGEFRLLEHECVHMLDLVVGEAEGGSSQHTLTRSASDGNIPDADINGSTEKEPHFDNAYILKRLQRVVRMSFVCFEIFDVILSLLVAESEDDSVWADLPGNAMEVLQKEMGQSINLFYEFVSYSATFHKATFKEAVSPQSLTAIAKDRLRQYLTRGMQSFSQWILEDDDLHRPMINVVEQLFPAQTNVPLISSTDAGLPNLQPEFCKRVFDVVLQGQHAMVDPHDSYHVDSYFRLASTASFGPTENPSELPPADARVELVESSHGDILVTCLALMTHISELEEEETSLSGNAKKMRFVCVNASRALCSIVCSVCEEVMSLARPVVDEDKGTVNGRSVMQWTTALSVAAMALELLYVVFQSRADKVGKDATSQHGDTVRDAMTADYMGLSVKEVKLLVAALNKALDEEDETKKPSYSEVSDSPEFEYWMDTNVQLLDRMRDLFSNEIIE